MTRQLVLIRRIRRTELALREFIIHRSLPSRAIAERPLGRVWRRIWSQQRVLSLYMTSQIQFNTIRVEINLSC